MSFQNHVAGEYVDDAPGAMPPECDPTPAQAWLNSTPCDADTDESLPELTPQEVAAIDELRPWMLDQLFQLVRNTESDQGV